MQTVKRSLIKCIGKMPLNDDELNFLLIEIKAVINFRPVTYVSDD